MGSPRTQLGAAVVCCASLAASALASPVESEVLKGPVEHGGRAKVEISSGHIDGTPVRRYESIFRHLTVRCDGERRLARLPVRDGFARNAEFAGPGHHWGVGGTIHGDPQDPDYATKVSGRQVNKNHAKGWVRVYGRSVGLRGGGHADCDSGRLHWRAHR